MPKEISDAPILATSGFGAKVMIVMRGPVNGKALRH
jgi:hypothetical protein